MNVPHFTFQQFHSMVWPWCLALCPHPHFPGLNATVPERSYVRFLTAAMWSSSENITISPFLCTDLIRAINGTLTQTRTQGNGLGLSTDSGIFTFLWFQRYSEKKKTLFDFQADNDQVRLGNQRWWSGPLTVVLLQAALFLVILWPSISNKKLNLGWEKAAVL